jgi:chaperone modulatory protein CbpM
MTEESRNVVLQSEIIETRLEMSLSDLCEVCRVTSEHVEQLVNEGLVEPLGGREPAEWRFSGRSVRRVVVAERLSRDLRLNAAGAALVLELLDEVKQLRQRLARLEENS